MEDFYAEMHQKQAEIAALKTSIQKEMQAKFAPALQAFFAKHPGTSKIVWRQYTPYFNDGEPCEFSVTDPELMFEGEEYGEYDEGEMLWGLKNMNGSEEYFAYVTPELIRDFSAIADMIQDEETMEFLFGDGVRVTASADGIDVEDYDHE